MAKHKYVESPEKLMQMWDEYKKSVDKDPEMEEIVNIKTGEIVHIAKKKPYLRSGFESFVYRTYGFLVKQYLDNQDKLYSDYMGVITCIRNEWETDQVSGTMTGKYKAPNLTARLNGLGDKQDITTQGQSINEIKVNIIK